MGESKRKHLLGIEPVPGQRDAQRKAQAAARSSRRRGLVSNAIKIGGRTFEIARGGTGVLPYETTRGPRVRVKDGAEDPHGYRIHQRQPADTVVGAQA